MDLPGMRNASRQGRECRTKHTPGRTVPVSVNRTVRNDWVEPHEFIRGSSQNSDNYLTAELSSGGGRPHTPICLGTIKYVFSDYDLEENNFISTNYNRIGYLWLLQEHFPPALSESSITIDLVNLATNKILETRTENISDLTTLRINPGNSARF